MNSLVPFREIKNYKSLHNQLFDDSEWLLYFRRRVLVRSHVNLPLVKIAVFGIAKAPCKLRGWLKMIFSAVCCI